MSWQPYVDLMKASTTSAAIISLEGIECGSSENWKAEKVELKRWAKMFNDPAIARQAGITYDGTKYFALEANNSFIHALHDHFSIYMKKTNSVIVIGTADDSISHEECKNEVTRVAQTLIDMGC